MWGRVWFYLRAAGGKSEPQNRINEWTPIAFWPLGHLVEEEEEEVN